jgi:hypothetical protein
MHTSDTTFASLADFSQTVSGVAWLLLVVPAALRLRWTAIVWMGVWLALLGFQWVNPIRCSVVTYVAGATFLPGSAPIDGAEVDWSILLYLNLAIPLLVLREVIVGRGPGAWKLWPWVAGSLVVAPLAFVQSLYFTITANHEIAGMVVDGERRPMPGVKVTDRECTLLRDPDRRCTATSGFEGRFNIPSAPLGPATLLIESRDHRRVAVTQTPDLVVQLLDPPAPAETEVAGSVPAPQ